MSAVITVTTNDRQVSVLGFPLKNGQPVGGGAYSELGTVPPHSEIEFTVSDSVDVLIREDVPLDVAEAAAEAQPEAA